MIEFLDRFLNLFDKANTLEILLFLLISIIIITMVMLSRNKDDEFDLKDLVSSEGRLNEKKFTRFGAWVISTWGFIYILINNPGNFPEWYFVGYMAVWVGNAIMDKYVDRNREEK